MASKLTHACVLSALVTSAAAIGCKGKLDVGAAPGERRRHDRRPGAIPFEPVAARIYVAKVKNLMLGLPPTEEEIAAVEAGSGGAARPGRRLVREARGAGQARHVLQQGLPADADRPRRLLRSGHRRRPPQPAAVHAAARVDVAHGAEDDRERPAVHGHGHDQHVHDDADDDVASTWRSIRSRWTTPASSRSACPCPTARSARRRPSGSPTGRPSIRTRRPWWRTRSRSPRRWTRAARTSCTSPCRPRSPAACRSWMTRGTSSSTTRAPR